MSKSISAERATAVRVGPTTSKVSETVASHPGLAVFALALLVRLLVVLLLSDRFSGVYVLDDGTYSFMAEGLAIGRTYNWDAYTIGLFERTAAFILPIAAVYKVFGTNEIAGRILVAFVGAGVAGVTARLALIELSRRGAFVAGVIVALLPAQVIFSSLVLKDAFVWIVLAGIGLAVARSREATGARLARGGIAIAILLFTLGFLRDHTLVVSAWALVIAAWPGEPSARVHRLVGAVALALVIPWAVGIGPAGMSLVLESGSLEQRRLANAQGAASALIDLASERGDEVARLAAEGVSDAEIATRLGMTAEQVEEAKAKAGVAPSASRGGGGQPSAEEVHGESGGAAPPPSAEPEGSLSPHLSHLPRGLAAMLIEPVPWRGSTSTSMTFAQAETIVWYPILLLATVGLWTLRRFLASLLFPVIVGAGSLLMYALAEGNIGTAYRHRGEFVWVIALMAAAGVTWFRERRSPRSA